MRIQLDIQTHEAVIELGDYNGLHGKPEEIIGKLVGGNGLSLFNITYAQILHNFANPAIIDRDRPPRPLYEYPANRRPLNYIYNFTVTNT